MPDEPPNGLLFLLIGPSGVGKNTIMTRVMERMPDLSRLPTVTTRAPRQGELEGREHYFKSLDEYNQLVADGAFVEYTEVHPGKWYGTLHETVREGLEEGSLLIADVDILGAQKIRGEFGERVVTIFVLPPDVEALRARIMKRQSGESDEEIEDRLRRADFELAHKDWCDYRVVNMTDAPDAAVNDVIGIIHSKLHKQPA
jgi:guanylate kinase